MPPRTRAYYDSVQQGYWRRFGSVAGGGLIERGAEQCDDLVGQGDCNHFVVNRYKASGGIINQSVDPGYWGAYFNSYIADGTGHTNFPHLVPDGPIPSVGDAAIQGINRTSPSRPYVDVPVNVLQLGELALLLKNTGKTFLDGLAGGNLKYQFGIKPLVGDLVKLINFNDQVERRVAEIGKLKSGKGLRRTVDIGYWDKTVNDSLVFQSQGAFISGPRTGHTKVGMRCHCRWSPTDVPALSSPKSVRALAKRAVLGATIDYSTLWEIMPWSWLIDWGFDIGGYLAANRNVVPASLSQCVVMTHTKTHWFAPASFIGDYGRQMSPFILDREEKRRQMPIVAPSAHFPFLSGNQMGIVASLAVTKYR
jgi:hypothetical protein